MSYEEESSKRHIACATLLEIMFDEPLRVFNGNGRLYVGDDEYLGAGDLGEISEITGGSDLEAADVRAVMSGIPSEYRQYLINTIARGKEVNIYSGFVNEATGEWATDVELDYAGFIDDSELTEAIDEKGGSSLTVELTFISAGAFARRFTVARRTHADQQARFAGDIFYSFLTDQRAAIPHLTHLTDQPADVRPRRPPNVN